MPDLATGLTLHALSIECLPRAGDCLAEPILSCGPVVTQAGGQAGSNADRLIDRSTSQ